MQKDFHYYATYCAAYLAGYRHDECVRICTAAQFVDLCSRTLLEKLDAPRSAATTQLAMEMASARTDLLGRQDITRIWASFHFLPYDLYAEKKGCTRLYRNKYRLICKPNGALLKDTVELARGAGLEAVGLAMHVLADTWAHSNFAGTPSLVINNTNYYFYEQLPDESWREVRFQHNPSAPDDPEKGLYTNSLFQSDENSVMNLGHGRAGHLPDYSFMRFKYLPAWDDYRELVKDNPNDYLHAFGQMIEAMKYLRGERESFELDRYDWDAVAPYEQQLREILCARRLIACEAWQAFGEKLSGRKIPDFSVERIQLEYANAEEQEKKDSFLGRFVLAALAQKSMVTNRIFKSGSLLAGFSVEMRGRGLKGIRDYWLLLNQTGGQDE